VGGTSIPQSSHSFKLFSLFVHLYLGSLSDIFVFVVYQKKETEMMTLSQVLKNIKLISEENFMDIDITSIEYDSRKVERGSMFVALRGAISDGHDFIQAALKRGATAILCEKIPAYSSTLENVSIICVEDTRAALAIASHNFYNAPSAGISVYGITGTNGKTTITYLLRSIFEETGSTCAIIGTTGIILGPEQHETSNTTPESLELAGIFSKCDRLGIAYTIMEVSSHALIQHRADRINFKGAIFTNLTHDHLDFHKTVEAYAKAKKILFDNLTVNSAAIVNGDDDWADYMLRDCKSLVKIKVGRGDQNDIIISDENVGLDKTTFTLKILGKEHYLELGIPGRFNIDNAAFAAALAYSDGINFETIESGLAKASGAPGRMQKVMLPNGSIGIVDYAHTPDALDKALRTCRDILKDSDEAGRLICVFGCGGDRDTTKRPVMGMISAELSDFSVITSDNPRTEHPDNIIEEIYSGVINGFKPKVICITNRDEAIRYALSISKQNDIILVAGKGHEKYQIIGKTKIYFDDVEMLKSFKD
jgi:UDP-N-acetylmuramoyl-L-alanyl-D-glutamate--2,6-diaminopimelate ligase